MQHRKKQFVRNLDGILERGSRPGLTLRVRGGSWDFSPQPGRREGGVTLSGTSGVSSAVPLLLRPDRAGSGQTGLLLSTRTPSHLPLGPASPCGVQGQCDRLPSAVAETEPALGWNGGPRRCCSCPRGAEWNRCAVCGWGQDHTHIPGELLTCSCPGSVSDTEHPCAFSCRRVLGCSAGGWWHTASTPRPGGIRRGLREHGTHCWPYPFFQAQLRDWDPNDTGPLLGNLPYVF